MYIIKISSTTSKFNFVNKLLDELKSKFEDYEFVNCTDSPINDYAYIEHNGMYYRKIIKNACIIVNESDYINSYERENLMKQGISLQEYIEMCLLFELEKIMIVSKFDTQIDSLVPLATILICPDGLNEIHFIGQDTLINDMIILLKQSKYNLLNKD